MLISVPSDLEHRLKEKGFSVVDPYQEFRLQGEWIKPHNPFDFKNMSMMILTFSAPFMVGALAYVYKDDYTLVDVLAISYLALLILFFLNRIAVWRNIKLVARLVAEVSCKPLSISARRVDARMSQVSPWFKVLQAIKIQDSENLYIFVKSPMHGVFCVADVLGK